MMRWAPLFAVVLPFATACDLDLPSESQVEDLRILDLQVSPPEISLFEPGPLELDPMRLPPFRRQEVTVRALVAHPDLDASFTFEWVRCRPGLGRIPCEEGEIRERLGSGAEPSFSFVPVDLILADAVAGEGMLDQLAAQFVEDPRDLINGLYAFINGQVSVASAAIAVDTPALEGVKRVVMFEPRLVAQAVREAQRLDPSMAPMVGGIDLPSLCINVDQGRVDAIYTYLSTRTPNRAPTYERVELRLFSGATTTTRAVAHGETIEVRAGDIIGLRGHAAEGDAEPYQLIDADCVVQPFTERLAFSWFTQLGEVSRNITTDDEPLLEWIAPASVDGMARARIWTILRDGRGGSDHRWFDVRVLPR